MAGRPLHCIEFSMLGAGQQRNPFDVPLGSGAVEFEVFDHAGQALPDAEIHDRFRALGLDTGFRLDARLRGFRRVATVAVKLIQMAQPATVEALSGGNVVDTGTMDAAQGVPQLITLAGRSIDQVVVTAPANETALIELCIGGR